MMEQDVKYAMVTLPHNKTLLCIMFAVAHILLLYRVLYIHV